MALEQAGVQLIAAGGDVYISTINNATKATGTFVEGTEKGGGRVSAAGEIITGALRKVGEVAVSALADAAKATASFVKDSIGVAGDFEAGMLRFQAVAGKGIDPKGLEKFKDLFISLGKELPVSTSEVEKAAIEMVSGGIDPAIVAGGALRSTIQFASAANLSLADAASTSAKFLAGWTSTAATTAEKVAFLTSSTDDLTKAAAASSTTAAELRLGIFNVQGAAQALHAPFQDVVATLAELAPAFESSAQAGTALNVFMSRLVPQTDTAAGVMQELGIITKNGQNIFFDTQGAFLGMGNAAEILKEKLGGLADEDKIRYLHLLFGNDAMKVGNLLMQDGAAGIDAMKAKMEAANGVADTAKLIQSGYNTALENAKGSFEALQITIGSALLPVLTGLMNDVIAPGVNILTDLASKGKVADETFNKLSPTMQDVATIAQGLFDDIKTGIGILSDIGSEAQSLISIFNKTGNTSGDLGKVIDDLGGIWQKLIKIVQDVGAGYQAVINAVLPIVSGFIAAHGTQISAFFQSAYDHIMAIVKTALDIYDAIVPKVLNSVAGWITAHATGIQSVISGAWNAISAIIDGALTIIEGVLKVALDLINGNWTKAWKDIQDMSVRVVQDIQQLIGGFLDIIAGFFNTSMSDILSTWQHNWDAAVDIVSRIDWIGIGRDIISGIVSGVEGAADSLYSTLKNLAANALQAAKDALGVSSPSKEFAAIGQFAVEGFLKGFVDAWPALIKQVGSLSKGLVSQMEDVGNQMRSAIADSFGATASIDRQVAKNLDRFKDVLPQYEQFTTGALKEAQQQASEFLDPAEGAKFFKMRSDQILEYAKLQKDLSEATTQEDKDRIAKQMELINKAQTAEISQFDATKAAASPVAAVADAFGAILKALSDPKMHWTNEQVTIFGQLANLWSQMQPPVTAQRVPYNPGAASYPSSSTQTNTSTRTYNMPIYTNQSPQVLQDSWAVMQASMP